MTKPRPGTKILQIQVDSQLHRILKIAAINNDTTIKELVASLIEKAFCVEAPSEREVKFEADTPKVAMAL